MQEKKTVEESMPESKANSKKFRSDGQTESDGQADRYRHTFFAIRPKNVNII